MDLWPRQVHAMRVYFSKTSWSCCRNANGLQAMHRVHARHCNRCDEQHPLCTNRNPLKNDHVLDRLATEHEPDIEAQGSHVPLGFCEAPSSLISQHQMVSWPRELRWLGHSRCMPILWTHNIPNRSFGGLASRLQRLYFGAFHFLIGALWREVVVQAAGIWVMACSAHAVHTQRMTAPLGCGCISATNIVLTAK